KKDWDMAISIFKEITGDLLYATPQFPLTNLGVAHYNKKEYLLAEKYYRQALKISPDSIRALRGLGLTQIDTGKYRQAVTTLEKALKIDPRLAETHFVLAQAYALSKDYKKALAAYAKVVELIPDTPMAASAAAGIKAIGTLKQ
ncbi:MAG: tetratricopeptide repeat protein, partial [Desulfobacterales bacterium]